MRRRSLLSGVSSLALLNFSKAIASPLSFFDPNNNTPAALRNIASNIRVPGWLNATITGIGQTQARQPHWNETSAPVTGLQLVYSNWMTNTNAEYTNPFPLTIIASIEYPSGTYTQVTFSTASSVVISSGVNLISDACPVTIPAGAQFWTRTYCYVNSSPVTAATTTATTNSYIINVPTSGIQIGHLVTGTGISANYVVLVSVINSASQLTVTNYPVTPLNIASGTTLTFSPTIPCSWAAAQPGTCESGSSLTNKTLGGTISTTVAGFGPSAILALTTSKSFGGIGDSIMAGAADGNYAAHGNTGFCGRSCDSVVPFLVTAVTGTQGALQVGNMTLRKDLFSKAGITHLVIDYGTNDLPAITTLSGMQTLHQELWSDLATVVPKIIQTTFPPRTTSTDLFNTTANQTLYSGASYPGGASSVRAEDNAWIRSLPSYTGGILYDYVELSYTLESANNSGLWQAGVSSARQTALQQTVTVAAGSTTTSINTTGFTPTVNQYAFGHIQFLTGVLAGNIYTTSAQTTGGVCTLTAAAPSAPAAGDTFYLSALTDIITPDGLHPNVTANAASALSSTAKGGGFYDHRWYDTETYELAGGVLMMTSAKRGRSIIALLGLFLGLFLGAHTASAQCWRAIGTLECSTSAAVAVQDPGPSAALFASPYYTCSTNYYVSQTGNDTTGTGTSGNPWLTLAHANSQLATNTGGQCVNVAPSGTVYSGLTVTSGGSSASSTGYVVYRCQTMDGCTVYGNSGQHGAEAFEMQWTSNGTPPNYVIVDGFTLEGNSNSTTNVNGVGFGSWNGTNGTALASHHIWLLNSIVYGFGQSGVGIAAGEYYYIIHNTIYNNSNLNCSAQGSGITVNVMNAVTGYSPTSDDLRNTVFNPTWTYATGTGNFFHNAIMWNNLYNNAVTACGTPSSPTDTDGNNIIFDSNSGNRSPSYVYTPYSLVAFNVTYNSGGGGVHVFYSQDLYVANNTCYNNQLDTGNGGTGRACMDESTGQSVNFLNNISVGIPTGNTSCFNNMPPYTRYNFAMLGSPQSGGTADTFSHNITQQIGAGCSSENNMYGNDVGQFVCTTSSGTNLCATAPSWVSVGGSTTGTDTTPPVGANFALQSGSPAIGAGVTETYLPATSVDVGACYHTLTSCP